MISQTLTAPLLKCFVNGKLLGIVTGIEWTVSSGRKPVSGIDQTTVQEWVPTTYTVSGRVSVIRAIGTGGLEGIGLVGFSDTTLLEKYLKIDLIDRSTDKVVFSAVNAVISSQNWSVSPKQVVTGSFSFEATQYVNEAAI